MENKIKKTSRHVRWNWHRSVESNADENNYVRYHFVVVDDRDRDGIMNMLLNGLARYSEVIPIRRAEGKVRGSEYRYLLCSYDSVIKPELLNWNNIKKPIRRDTDLRERQKGNIEDYVASVYS